MVNRIDIMRHFQCEKAANDCTYSGAEIPMPYAANLEVQSLPQIEDVVIVVRKLVGKK